jgi:hypothetical protein
MYRLVFCLISILPVKILAQIGGERVFESLNVPVSTFQSGLGGVNVSSTYQQINLMFSNPALLHPDQHQTLGLNYTNYMADIYFLSATYAHDLDKIGIVGMGLQYFDYGSFEGADDTGQLTGEFSANDFTFSLVHSRAFGNFRYGMAMKVASARIESFGSTAMLFDLGATFKHPNADLQLGLVIKNIGFLFSDFTSTSTSQLPYDIQLGASFKPEYMPFRFSITAYNLWRGNIAYFDEDLDSEEPSTADNIFRHINFGMEILIGQNINALIGYNHLVRQELKLEEASGAAGFSFGLQVRVKSFEIGVSRSIYSVAGGSTFFSLTTNFQQLLQKKTLKTGNIENNG